MQIAYTFDRASLKKIGKGLLISLAGAALAGFVVLALQLNGFILDADPINWRAVIYACWGAFSTSIINTAKEWFAGMDKAILVENKGEVIDKVSDMADELVDSLKEKAVQDVKQDIQDIKNDNQGK